MEVSFGKIIVHEMCRIFQQATVMICLMTPNLRLLLVEFIRHIWGKGVLCTWGFISLKLVYKSINYSYIYIYSYTHVYP